MLTYDLYVQLAKYFSLLKHNHASAPSAAEANLGTDFAAISRATSQSIAVASNVQVTLPDVTGWSAVLVDANTANCLHINPSSGPGGALQNTLSVVCATVQFQGPTSGSARYSAWLTGSLSAETPRAYCYIDYNEALYMTVTGIYANNFSSPGEAKLYVRHDGIASTRNVLKASLSGVAITVG